MLESEGKVCVCLRHLLSLLILVHYVQVAYLHPAIARDTKCARNSFSEN